MCLYTYVLETTFIFIKIFTWKYKNINFLTWTSSSWNNGHIEIYVSNDLCVWVCVCVGVGGGHSIVTYKNFSMCMWNAYILYTTDRINMKKKCSSQIKLSNTPLLCKNGLLDRGIKTIGPKQSGQISSDWTVYQWPQDSLIIGQWDTGFILRSYHNGACL